MYLPSPTFQFDFFTPHCECDPIDVEWDFDTMNEYRKSPETALCRACGSKGEQVGLKMLKAITTLAVQEEGSRSILLAEHFIQMIIDGYTLPLEPSDTNLFKQKRCHWELPLVGLHNILIAIRRDGKTGPEDGSIIGKICGEYKKIFEVVMRDLPKLLPAGPHANHLRNTIVKTIAILADDCDFRNSLLLDEKSMELILTCWTHMSAPDRDDVNALVHQFYEDSGECRACSIDPERHSRAVYIIGVNTLIQKFEEWLINPNTLDESLRLELQTIFDFLRASPPYGKQFSAAKTQVHVMAAMKRQKQHGDPSSHQMIYHLGFLIVTFLTLDMHYLATNKIEGLLPGSIELAMTALAIDSDTRDFVLPPPDNVCRWHTGFRELHDMGYHEYMEEVLTIFERDCSDTDCCEHTVGTEAFSDTCREQAEKIHIPISRRLLVRGYEGNTFAKEVYRLWKRLATVFNITEASVREKWIKEGECWNPWCSKRGDKSVKTKRCARCQTIRYCSTACQKADWKEHKARCIATSNSRACRT